MRTEGFGGGDLVDFVGLVELADVMGLDLA